jgi:hypothetical protein
MRKSLLKAAAFLLLSTGIAASAWAQITISNGFALSNMAAKIHGWSGGITGNVGVGSNVYIDYLLPINIPLSLGGEIGIDGSSFTTNGWNSSKDNLLAIPILYDRRRAAGYEPLATNQISTGRPIPR